MGECRGELINSFCQSERVWNEGEDRHPGGQHGSGDDEQGEKQVRRMRGIMIKQQNVSQMDKNTGRI